MSEPQSDVNAADVREGGRWTFAQRIKNDFLFVAISTALFGCRFVPTPALRALGRFVAFVAWIVVPSWRRIALENIERAFPHFTPSERTAFLRRNYRTLGGLLGEAIASLDPSRAIDPLPFLPGARETIDAAIAEGRGVVFASAHLGPWERVAWSMTNANIPLTVVAREPYDPRLASVYEKLRAARGVRAVYRGADGAGIALVRVLRKRGVLGIPMDLASRVPSIDAPFFHHHVAKTAVGPARIALRTNAVVVVGTVARHENQLGISFTRVDLPDQADEASLTEAINRELAKRILDLPEAWLWMHRRFN